MARGKKVLIKYPSEWAYFLEYSVLLSLISWVVFSLEGFSAEGGESGIGRKDGISDENAINGID